MLCNTWPRRRECIAAIVVAVQALGLNARALPQEKERASFNVVAPGERPTSVAGVAFSKDHKLLATILGERIVKVWRVKDRELMRTFRFDQDTYYSLGAEFLPSGNLFVLAQRRPVSKGWETWKCDVKTGAMEQTRAASANQYVCAIGAARKLIMVLENPRYPITAGTLKCIDLDAKKKDVVVPCELPYDILGFSRDGRLAVLGTAPVKGHGEMRVMEIASGKQVTRFAVPLGGARSAMLSGDNKTLATVLAAAELDSRVVFWDIATGKERFTRAVTGHVDKIADLSPNGRLMAVIANRADVHLFDFRTGQFEAVYVLGLSQIRCLQFAPDGKTFATGSQDGQVRILASPDLEPRRPEEKK